MKKTTDIEVRKIVAKVKRGEKGAIESLISLYEPKIYLAAKRVFYGAGDDLSGGINAGRLAVYHAAMRFDLTGDVRFNTYAHAYISGGVRNYFRDFGPIARKELINNLSKDIKNYLQICFSQLDTADDHFVSRLPSGSQMCAADYTNESFEDIFDFTENIATYLSVLKPRDQVIVKAIAIDGMSYRDVSEKLKYSPQYINVRYKSAIQKMRLRFAAPIEVCQ